MSTSNGFTEINGIFDSVADLQKYSGKSISTVAVNNGTVLDWYQVSTIDNGSAVALDSGLFANLVAPSVAGFGTAAYEDITTSATDTTAGRITKVGDFGLGSEEGLTPPSDDANNAIANGFYRTTSTTLNTPSAYTATIITSNSYNVVQQLFLHSSDLYVRRSTNDGTTWTAWVEVWTTDNLVKTTSSNDATAGRVLTQGSIGFEYQRHIKTTKAFASAGTGTSEVFYLGTIVSGIHNIQFSTRGNSGYNTYEINLEMTFNNTGTDGVSPHVGVTATSKIEGAGANEFLGFSTIKVNGSTAAVYLLYQDPSQIHNLQVGYNSFTADTIGVSPNATETWTPLSVATAISGSNDIPTLLYMDGTSLSYNGDEVLTDGNTNLNEFITNTVGERLLEGVAVSTTEIDFPLPTPSFTYPASITAVGGYEIKDARSSAIVATGVLPALSPIATPNFTRVRFTVVGAVVGKRYLGIATSNNSKITVNF